MPEYRYGPTFRPPAPMLPIGVSGPGATAAMLVPALVDTGAGMTALPSDVPRQLGLPVAGRTIVAGFDGRARIVPTYAVQIRVAEHTAVLKVIGLGAVALLGRDVLNTLFIRLRGPEGILEVDEPPP